MNLFLFTKTFPYGKGETFLESEIKVLANNFSEIHIFPWKKESVQREMPINCVVHNVSFGSTKGLKSIFIAKFSIIIRTIFLDLVSGINRKALKRPKAYKDDLFRALYEGKQWKDYTDKNITKDKALWYTYWFSHWTELLSFVKGNNQILITRTHGYDFNLERNKNGYFPFRPFCYKKLTRNFNVSQFGSKYLKNLYKSEREKIKVSYLGVPNQIKTSKKDSKVLISCSNVISLKRNELIVDLLKEMNEEIHWIHFGDGELLEELKNKCKELPKNIKVTFKGHLENKELLKWYSKNEFNTFIHLSESEGLPVSMLEAQSFGMPILACNVGGVAEIVNEFTGYLLPKNFSFEEGLIALKEVMNFSDEKRLKIQNHQQKLFSSERNYQEFALEIKNL